MAKESSLVDVYEFKRRKRHDEDKMTDMFCPIIKNACRRSCVCFEEAKWSANTNGVGYYTPPQCGHALICGFITVEVYQ